MPALQSKWLLYHLITAVFSYGAFGVAFGLGILYLVLHRTKEGTFIKNYLPKQEKIEPLRIYRFSKTGITNFGKQLAIDFSI